MARISLNQQIEKVDLELAERSRTYPGLDVRNPGGRSQRQYQVMRLEAVKRTLEWLRRYEQTLKERCPEMFEGSAK